MVYEYGYPSDTMVPPHYHAHYLIGAKTLEFHTLEIINYEVLKALNVRMLVDARSNIS